MSGDNIKSVGFAIATPDDEQLGEDALEFLKRELTEEDVEAINDDIMTIEGNALMYLRQQLYSARDEGHGGHNGMELIGTAWYDADDPEQVDFVMFRSEHADNADPEVEPALYAGISEVGMALLADMLKIEFFDVPEEDYEEWEESQ